MFLFALMHLISFFVDLISIGHISERDKDLELLILRHRDSPFASELLKLSYSIGRSTVRDVLKRNMLAPVPTRGQKGGSWRTFLTHYKEQILACDFFTVETAWLKTVDVLFFIEIGTRRVHLA